MENLKIKSVYHFNKNEIEYIRQKYQIKNEIPEKTEVINSDIQIIGNHNSKIITKKTVQQKNRNITTYKKNTKN